MKKRAQHSRRRRRRPERAHAAARRICNTVRIVYIVGEGWRNLPRVVALLLRGVIASLYIHKYNNVLQTYMYNVYIEPRERVKKEGAHPVHADLMINGRRRGNFSFRLSQSRGFSRNGARVVVYNYTRQCVTCHGIIICILFLVFTQFDKLMSYGIATVG